VEQFEHANSLKYLATMVNTDNSILEEIKKKNSSRKQSIPFSQKTIYIKINIAKHQTTNFRFMVPCISDNNIK
jgi:hypothetical protein